jgi:NhaA family Na+:H+ antiporter
LGGVIFGLVVGKPLGIFGTVYLVSKVGWVKKPSSLRWIDIFGVSMLGGIGFTMSIFVTDIAFVDHALIDLAKLSIMIASVLSAVMGAFWLYMTIIRKSNGNR